MSPELLPVAAEPLLDPENVGLSMQQIHERLTLHSGIMRGNVLGEALSRSKGPGFEIDGVRDYAFGDDVRNIDWALSAASPLQTLQVRQHYQEITPNLLIVTDALQRRNEANPGYFSEQQLALSAVATLLQIGEVHGMPTAVVATDDAGLVTMPHRFLRGKRHLLGIASKLAGAMPESDGRSPEKPMQSYLSDALQYAGQRCVGNVVAVVSDFRDVAFPDDQPHGWVPALRQLAGKRNTLLAVETTNPSDFELNEYDNRFKTAKGILWIGNDKVGKAQRAEYADKAKQQQAAIDQNLRAVGAHHIKLSTTNPAWLTALRTQIRAVKPR